LTCQRNKVTEFRLTVWVGGANTDKVLIMCWVVGALVVCQAVADILRMQRTQSVDGWSLR